MYEKNLKGNFNSRDIKIIQKAKTYGVEILSNEELAKELFELTFEQDLDKDIIEQLLKFYNDCDESIEMAQMSS
ncbi:MAG: hypothetical protein JJV95_02535 [Sulfurospirillum sp.]|nr:hypothetical protein [Sulfurospirillum sp.]MBL0702849.1 hypothetical protein [Sulfurospirillum sp.]